MFRPKLLFLTVTFCWLSVFLGHSQHLRLSLQTGHSGPIEKILFDPSGRWIISSGDDQLVILWDIQTGKQVMSYAHHNSKVVDFDLHPSEPWVVSLDEAGQIYTWEYPSGKIIQHLEYQPQLIHRIAYSPDGKHLILAGTKVWKRPLSEMEALQSKELGQILSFDQLAISPRQKYLAVASYSDEQIYLLNYQTLELLETLPCPNPTDLYFGKQDEVLLASGAQFLHKITVGPEKRKLKPWRITAENRWHTFQAVTGTENYLIGAAKNDLIQIHRLQNGKKERTLKAHLDQINTLAVNPDETILASGGYDGYILLWDLSNGELIRPIYGFIDQINCLSFDASGEQMLIGYRNGTVRAWHLPSNRIYTQNLVYEKGRTSERIYRWNYSVDSIRQLRSEGPIQVFAQKRREVKEVQNQRIVPLHWVTTWFKTKDVSIRTTPYVATWDLQTNEFATEKNTKEGKGYEYQVGQTVLTHSRGPYRVRISSDRELTIQKGSEVLVETIARHQGKISSLLIHPKQDIFVTGSWDGTIKFWDLQTGEELLSAIALGRSDFLYLTPDNFYFLSKSAVEGVAFNYRDQVLSFEQFDYYYNRPHLALQKLPFWNSNILDLYEASYKDRIIQMGLDTNQITIDLDHLPSLQLRNERALPLTTPSPDLVLEVQAQDEETPLKSIDLFINGVPLEHPWKDLKGASHRLEATIPVRLSVGQNIIQLSASNTQGGRSLEKNLSITYNPKKAEKPDLYIVAIGASEYQLDSTKNLDFAAKDAKNISELMAKRKKEFRQIKPITLLNDEVTPTAVAQTKEQLMQSRIDDQVIIFYAGHGILDQNNNLVLSTYVIDFQQPNKQGLPYRVLEGLVEGIPARKKLILIDACHSGEVDQSINLKKEREEELSSNALNFRDPNNQVGIQASYDLMKEIFADVRRGTGATILASARGGEAAQEGVEWGNGVFTHALIKGLEEKAADLNKDKSVTLSEIQVYLSQEVPKLTKGKQQPTYRTENLILDYALWR